MSRELKSLTVQQDSPVQINIEALLAELNSAKDDDAKCEIVKAAVAKTQGQTVITAVWHVTKIGDCVVAIINGIIAFSIVLVAAALIVKLFKSCCCC